MRWDLALLGEMWAGDEECPFPVECEGRGSAAYAMLAWAALDLALVLVLEFLDYHAYWWSSLRNSSRVRSLLEIESDGRVGYANVTVSVLADLVSLNGTVTVTLDTGEIITMTFATAPGRPARQCATTSTENTALELTDISRDLAGNLKGYSGVAESKDTEPE